MQNTDVALSECSQRDVVHYLTGARCSKFSGMRESRMIHTRKDSVELELLIDVLLLLFIVDGSIDLGRRHGSREEAVTDA